MKSNKLIVAVLIFALTMSGCIAGGDTDKVQDKFKKANDKVVLKSSVKHKLPSKKKYPRKDSKKDEKKDVDYKSEQTQAEHIQVVQPQLNQSQETSSQKPVFRSQLLNIYTEQQLLDYANAHFDDYWNKFYRFMAGTYFESTGEVGKSLVIDPNIHSLQDVENVWYQYFAKKYSVQYMDTNINCYVEIPFWEEDGQVYERYCVGGLFGFEYYFNHITKITDDEVWFELYAKGLDGSINDTNQQWSFVYEDGQLKYGTIIRN